MLKKTNSVAYIDVSYTLRLYITFVVRQALLASFSLVSCLFHVDFNLDEETFRALWFEYSTQGGIDYDEYVAALTKLQILKGIRNLNKITLVHNA